MSDIQLPGGGTLKLYDSIYTPQQIEAAIGKGPMIQNGTWWLWDVATMKYWDTGYSLAEGLGPGAVTTPMLADGSVTTPKMADGAVDWTKIAPEARRINDNLLGNAYFIGGGSQQGGGQFPINQRGLTEYTADGPTTYCVDRICFNRLTVTLTADGLKMKNTRPSPPGYISSKIEFSRVENGSLLTFSALVDSNLYTFSFVASDTMSDVSVNFGAIRLEFSRELTLGNYYWATIYNETDNNTVSAMKLEHGPHQTLAHESAGGWILNDPAPNFADELMRCRRYYRVGKMVLLTALKGVYLAPSVEFDFPMRATPTVTITNPKRWSDDASMPEFMSGYGRQTGFCVKIKDAAAQPPLEQGKGYYFDYAADADL